MKQRDTGSKEVQEVEEVKESDEWRVVSKKREKQVPRCACLAGWQARDDNTVNGKEWLLWLRFVI
jgi:hypothetical protein